MKKLLAAIVAFSAVSAMADHKHLVSFDGSDLKHFARYVIGDETKKNDGAKEKESGLSLRVNYAWKVHSNIFVGGILGYSNNKEETTPVKVLSF